MAIKLNTPIFIENPAYNFSLYLKRQLEKNIDEKIEQKNNPLVKYTSSPTHLNYTIYSTLFGQAIIVYVKENIYYLAFFDDIGPTYVNIKKIFTHTELVYEKPGEDLYNNIFVNFSSKLNLYIRGTPFQIKVWETLYTIKQGALVSYENIAFLINMPKALRAVGNAISKNNISFLIPCHRVISKDGSLNNYAWGVHRKKELILHESSLSIP